MEGWRARWSWEPARRSFSEGGRAAPVITDESARREAMFAASGKGSAGRCFRTRSRNDAPHLHRADPRRFEHRNSGIFQLCAG